MNKKLIFVVAGIVLIVVIATGAVFFLKKDTSTTDSTKTATTNTSASDESSSEDLGLCTIVDIATVKSALGSVADTLSGPNDTGVTSLGDGDKGQTCVYPFVAGGTTSNSFYTDLAQYTQESFDNVADFTATSGAEITGVGDRATFKSSEPLTGGKEFTITAVKGTNVYLFVISQPSDKITFDDASAQAALTTIAQSAKLK